MVPSNKKQIEINQRQIEIIHFLASREKHVTIKSISEMYDRSQRTIRNDLDAIEYVLKRHNMSLERKPRVGIKLNFDELQIEKLLSMYKNKIYLADERALLILVILMSKERTSFEELAEILQVSKNTVIQDLKTSEKLLEDQEMKITRKPYYGISLVGNEGQIRSYLLKLYKGATRNIQIDINQYLVEGLTGYKNASMSLIEFVEESANVTYSEEAVNELELMINFSLCRISIGKSMEYSEEYIEKQKLQKNYKTLQRCLRELNYNITESEICYFLKLFSGAKSTLGNFITTNSNVDKLTVSIIQDMCDAMNIDINLTEDLELKEQMSLHLKVAIFRLKNNMIISNPMLEEIKYKIPFIYSIAETILSTYEDTLKIEFPESEIAYIAMYFAALYEKNVKHKRIYKVLLVCNCGLATSSLLKTRIREMLSEIEIVDTCRLRDVEAKVQKYEFDFIISTVPLVLDDYKVIQVNPLLGLTDIEKIKKETFNRRYENSCQTLANKVKNKNYSEISILLPRKYAQIGIEINNWREAIKYAAQPLINDQKIEENYVSEMIKVVENIGTYMVFISEIAFVHADSAFVIENSVSILVLKNPIKFGSKNETLVKVIIVLANRTENMNLVNLINIITKEGNIDKLKEATSYEDIEKIN